MKDFSKLEKRIGIEFDNQDLLAQAFVHRSYLNEHPDFKLGHNERLEFLGDAVLELVVTDHLYRKYPQKSEGVLTNWRASLVNSDQLAQTAKNLELNEFLFLSRGEAEDNSKARHFILANTFEALVGAIYLDQGYPGCQKFIKRELISCLPEIIESGAVKDDKSRFQEEAQERLGITPVYKVLKEWGPDHNKHFVVGAFLQDKMIAKGEGSSKQEGELKAASEALKAKGW